MKHYAIGLLIFGLGCGGDDGDGKDKDAPEKCQMFISTLCDKLASCQVDSGDIEAAAEADTSSQCVATLASQGFDCAEAVNAPPDLDQCVEDIDAAECANFDIQADGTPANVPASCIP